MEPRLNWLVFGAGAIGTYIGGSLLLHGQKVVFLEQQPVDSELRANGFKLNLNGQDYRILHPVVFSSLPSALSYDSYDAVIFALKSYDTNPALDLIRPYASSFPPVLCLQNGVENEPSLAAVLGAEKVIAGTVTSAVKRMAVGDIQLERLRGVGIAWGNIISERIVQAFSEAHLNAHLFQDPVAMKWSKMLTNLLCNASSAILDMSPRQILRHPGLYRMELEQIKETMAVMNAQDIRVINLPRTSVRLFTAIVNKVPPSISQPFIALMAGRGRGTKMPSFHIDFHSGRSKSEVDYLNGAVVRYGERFGIRTPVNRLLNETLLRLTQDSRQSNEFTHQSERLINELKKYLA